MAENQLISLELKQIQSSLEFSLEKDSSASATLDIFSFIQEHPLVNQEKVCFCLPLCYGCSAVFDIWIDSNPTLSRPIRSDNEVLP